ncbi:MAG: DUF1553 domain-containing protein [Pirellulales bacterium]
MSRCVLIARWTSHQPAVVAALCLFAVLGGALAPAAADEALEFNRDIRPLLSDNCFQCHGPDQAQRQAELRLDVEASAKRDHDGVRPVVPGDPAASELVRRLKNSDPDERMPPPKSGKHLTADEIARISRWIEQGAQWQKHWAFLPPVRSPVPAVRAATRMQNPIDAFVLARLEAAGQTLSPEAPPAALIRRVTLDLTGLPPTPAEVDAFLADQAPAAYERVVDRLLASPRYGERMAARWLDAARYADTNGYQDDGVRHMWRWRDWVIDAYNRNLPFDRFTVEQLAGDLLPDATLEQQIATGFNRNHRTNAEGGIIPEEYAVEYVVDRVDTTATVWLGLTMGCARCHDHKFDPVTQREFYQVFAYFNNVPERGRGIKVGNSPPTMKAPTGDQQQQLAAVDSELAAAESTLAALHSEIAALEAAWAASSAASQAVDWVPNETLLAHLPFDGSAQERVAGKPAAPEGNLTFESGSIAQAAAFDGAALANAGDVGNFGFFDKFTLAAWVLPRAANGTILARMANDANAEGYSLELVEGKLQVNLSKRWLDDALRVETAEPLAMDRWQHVAVTYDGTRVAPGIRVYVDGQERPFKVLLDELNQTFNSKEPLRIGGGGRSGPFRGALDNVLIYKSALATGEVALLAEPAPINAIATTPAAARSPRQAATLRAYFLAEQAPPHVREAIKRIHDVRARKHNLEEGFPTTMVMVEMAPPRETFLLERGQYDKPAARVSPAVPAVFQSTPIAAPDRLAFARWLVAPDNPLVPRVAVNRYWQSFFGTGLVKTVDDFGAQGEAPSHPELLDWLAREFVDGGWNVKHMQRLMVTSATYRQSSAATAEAFARDPDNRLLARGPRLRLPAEMIRDQALAASGLLVEQPGGPSVNPYQPPGLWKELTGGKEFEQDHGAGLYRRSLYTFWKRTIAPPSMITFDASPREACTVRETRTNTPLQALTLLNETTFVEAARVLAARVLANTSIAGSNGAAAAPRERIALAFRLVLARSANEHELNVLGESYERHLARFRAAPQDAARLLAVGEAPRDQQLEAAELAAYSAVCNLIFNLDEAVTKE